MLETETTRSWMSRWVDRLAVDAEPGLTTSQLLVCARDSPLNIS